LYDGELMTLAPADRSSAAAITLAHVPKGVADAEGANLREAETVADLVVEHLRARPEHSLGVLTMTSAQARLIEDQVEQRLAKRPELEKGVAIKTVDQAVGEDRDVVILSLGFSPELKGQPPADLGLLALDHGARWLQPALTGARRKLVLVTSLTASQLQTKAKPAPALVFLRELLELAASPPSGAASDSEQHPLARQVAQELRRQGVTANGPIGDGTQPVELVIADQALAIEFDGPAYHAAATVRDRDRLRREALTRLGWTVHRIWAPAWIAHRDEELQRLLRAVKDAGQRAAAKKTPPSKAAAAPRPGVKAGSR
jgi:hypothetical protein